MSDLIQGIFWVVISWLNLNDLPTTVFDDFSQNKNADLLHLIFSELHEPTHYFTDAISREDHLDLAKKAVLALLKSSKKHSAICAPLSHILSTKILSLTEHIDSILKERDVVLADTL